jgi:hypothetical protein
MMSRLRLVPLVLGALAIDSGRGAAQAALAQQAPPVRRLTTPVASDSGLFGNALGVRALSNGRVIVNDVYWRRLLMFDSTMKTFRIIADTSAGSSAKYPNPTNPIPYLGDSTLLVDRDAQTLLVIDPTGTIVRSMAAPRSADLSWLAFAGAYAVIDPKGRLVYRAVPPRATARDVLASDSGKVFTDTYHDSAAIVRADFDTRSVDTLATHASPVRKELRMATGRGFSAPTIATDPLPETDAWAMLTDGTIAIVRGHDYHIDWIHLDGTRTSSPKMPFDWKRVPLEEKQRLIDSTKQVVAVREAGQIARIPSGRGAVFRVPLTTVEASDLPDYYPPIRPGTVKADADGNLWILPTTSVLAATGLTYDVVNRKGEIIERVTLPPQRAVLALGKGGVVYMSNTSGNVYRIERARVIR